MTVVESLYKFRVHLVLLSIQLCFSGWHVIGSVALQTADPLVFAIYREVSASLLMLAVVYYNGSEAFSRIHPEDYIRFIYVGFCSFTNVVGTLFALQLMPATRYSVMQPTIPVMATIVSVAIGLENLTVYKCIGIALAVGGAMTIELWKSEGNDTEDDEFDSASLTLGMIIVVLQCFGMANLLVFQQPLVKRYNTAFVTMVYYGIGTIITLVMSACWFQRFESADFYFNGSILPLFALIYAAIFATLYAYNAYAWAGRKVDPSISAIYCTVQPVGTALLSMFIFGDIPTVSELLGGFLVAVGLVVTIRGKVLEQELQRKLHIVSGAGAGSTAASGDDRDQRGDCADGAAYMKLNVDEEAPTGSVTVAPGGGYTHQKLPGLGSKTSTISSVSNHSSVLSNADDDDAAAREDREVYNVLR